MTQNKKLFSFFIRKPFYCLFVLFSWNSSINNIQATSKENYFSSSEDENVVLFRSSGQSVEKSEEDEGVSLSNDEPEDLSELVGRTPEFNLLIKLYKEKMGIGSDTEEGQDEKEHGYISDIIETIEELKCYLVNSSSFTQNIKSIKNCRHKFYEAVYLFLRHRPNEIKQSWEKPWSTKEAQVKAKTELEAYFQEPHIAQSIAITQEHCPSLINRRSSLSDIAGFFGYASLGNNPYLLFIAELIKEVEQPLAVEVLEEYLKSLIIPFKNIKILRHYQKEVVPLLRIFQTLTDISHYLDKKAFSSSELKHLENKFSLLGAEVSGMQGSPGWVHYDYIDISEEDVERAEKNLISQDTLECRAAGRIVLHSRIPWKSFTNIGNFLHDSDRGSPKNLIIFQQALPELIKEIRDLRVLLTDLADYESLEFSSLKTSANSLQERSIDIEHITRLAHYRSDVVNLKKIRGYISQFHTSTPIAMKEKYAVLRALEVIGEAGKNLSSSLKETSNLEFWKFSARLRDLFAHLERSLVKQRLDMLLEDNKIWINIIEKTFLTLNQYIDQELEERGNAKSWEEINSCYNSQRAVPLISVDIEPIKRLLALLEDPLSLREKESLLATLEFRGRLIEPKTLVISVLGEGTAHNDQEAFFAAVDQLPLTKGQKDKIKEAYKNFRKTGTLVEEKKNVIRTLINSIEDYDEDQKADDFTKELIKNLLKHSTFDTVSTELDKVRITEKSEWQRLHSKITKKNNILTSAPTIEEKDKAYRDSLKKSINATKSIIRDLYILRDLTQNLRDLRSIDPLWQTFMKDKTFYSACEYCLASFRKHARILASNASLLKDYTLEDSPLMNYLMDNIKNEAGYQVLGGNAIFHHHDLSTFETRTPDGLKFCTSQEVMRLLDGRPYGENDNRLPSTIEKFEQYIKLAEEHLMKIGLN